MPFGRYTCEVQWQILLDGSPWHPKGGDIWSRNLRQKMQLQIAFVTWRIQTRIRRFRLSPNYFGSCCYLKSVPSVVFIVIVNDLTPASSCIRSEIDRTAWRVAHGIGSLMPWLAEGVNEKVGWETTLSSPPSHSPILFPAAVSASGLRHN